VTKHRNNKSVYTNNTAVIIKPLESRDNYSATSNNMKLVHWPLMGRRLHLVQRRGDRPGPSSPYQM